MWIQRKEFERLSKRVEALETSTDFSYYPFREFDETGIYIHRERRRMLIKDVLTMIINELELRFIEPILQPVYLSKRKRKEGEV